MRAVAPAPVRLVEEGIHRVLSEAVDRGGGARRSANEIATLIVAAFYFVAVRFQLDRPEVGIDDE